MRPARIGLLSLLVVSASCSESPAPLLPHAGYELLEVDGTPLPTGSGVPEGYLLVRRDLVFTPSSDQGEEGEEEGEVRLTTHILPPGRPLQRDVTLHHYTITSGMISINLCPIGALCTALLVVLSGPTGPDELVLHESAGGRVVHTFTYRPVLPE